MRTRVFEQMRMADLQRGWLVLGNDGQRLGTVRDVTQNYLITSRGALATPLYVPSSAIANVERDAVHLNLAKNEAEQMGWEEAPREPDPADKNDGTDLLHRHV